MLSYILNGLYLIIWAVLLIHCLHSREFYPILGRKLGTKILWLFTFIFFNPLLSLLYVIFAVLLRPRKVGENSKPVYLGSIAAILGIVLVIVIFELPLGGSETEPVIVMKSSEIENPAGDNKISSSFEPLLGVIKATNKVQTYSSSSAGTDTKVSLRNIVILCNNPHNLIDRVAREFQKALIRLPYIESVTYYSYGTWPEKGGLLPDVFITIDMPVFSEKDLFRSRKINATVKWQAGNSVFDNLSRSFDADSSPIVKFNIESELNHISSLVGIESPQAKYKLESKNISAELTQSIRKQFENLLDKYGRLPELPDMLYGVYQESPEFSFIKNNNVYRQVSGSGLLTNNDTIWQFTDERPTEKALAAYHDELASLGWTAGDRDSEYLKMQNNNEKIYIYRQRNRNVEAGFIVSGEDEESDYESPMIAHYKSCWNEERMQEVMDRFLDVDNIKIETLLIFEKYFKTPQQRERLCSLIEQSPVPNLDGYLVLTRFWADNNEPEVARKMLMFARAMQYAEKGYNVKAHEIENLAERLGDESLTEIPISDKIFCKTGFINADEIEGQITVERGLDEPLLFYRRLDEGELHTLMLRVIRSQEPLPVRSYRLLTVEKRKGSSSSVEEDGRIESNDNWTAEYYLHNLTDKDTSVYLKIESLVDERFRFIITTE
jgi:hypothetical protein